MITTPEPSVLIVEDEERLRSLLIEIMSTTFQCSSAETAGQAIRMMDQQFFHLALVDMGLPGMSGLSLCRLIVNRWPRTSVIVVSGETNRLTVAEAMNAGAVGYVTKPFNLSELIETVSRVLGRQIPGAVA